jgi:hypothetical protein
LIGARRAQGIDYRRSRRSRQATNPPTPRGSKGLETIAIIDHRTRHDLAAIDLAPNVRPPRRAVLIAAGIAAALAAVLVLTELPREVPRRPPLPLAAPDRSKELVALVRPGPVVYFPGVDGRIEGLDADLLRLYAAERKLTLRFVAIATAAELETALGNGDAHLGVGGLIEPPATSGSASPDAGTARRAIA